MIHNLPVQPTPFFSRAAELSEISSLLVDSACRLLTLVGPGGIGKTRLALEAANGIVQRETGHFPQGVYFVALQPLDTPDLLVSAIAQALELQLYEAGGAQQELLNGLRERSLLLVLDNFEHLLDGAELLSEILAAAPGVRMLVTSRERLNLREEWVLEVNGLNYPQYEGQHDIERYSAVQFFLQNAQRAQVGFQLTEGQKPAVAHISRLVSGMPLAIELAAAWVRVMPCEQIAAEIERSLDVLETPARNVPPRHRNMRAVFEPTWTRLPKVEQTVFMRLSVFRGGFQREAAQTVAGATLPVLSALVDKSLLRVNSDGRYDIHELLRQYGEEQLSQSGKGDMTRDAHSAYYMEFLAQREPDIKGRRQLEGLKEIGADFENIRTAWHWSLAWKNYQALSSAAESLFYFCEMRARFLEGRELLWAAQEQLAVETDPELQPIWGRVLVRSLWLGRWSQDDLNWGETAKVQAEIGLTIARQQGDKTQTAFCLWLFGALGHGTPNAAAIEIRFLEESLALFTELDDRFYMARVADWLGSAYGSSDQREKFVPLSEQSLKWRRAIGDQFGVTSSLVNLIDAASEMGQHELAKQYIREMGRIYQEINSGDWMLRQPAMLSRIAFQQGDFQEARRSAEETLQLASRSGLVAMDVKRTAFAVLGMLAALEEDYTRSWQLCEQAPSGMRLLNGLAVAACGLGNYAIAQSYFLDALKEAFDFRDPRGITAVLPIGAILLVHQDQPERAVELLGLAFQHPASAKAWLEQWPLLTRLRAQLESELGSTSYARAWERGKHSDLNAVAKSLLQYFQPDELQEDVQSSNSRLVDPLTDRELEVLNAIAAGANNAAIAEQMVVEVSTIKKHLTHIYDKLGVTSRTQAIARGRELGLL